MILKLFEADAQSVLLVKPGNTTAAEFEFHTVILYHHTVLESMINRFFFIGFVGASFF